jgi:uncharacterized membrane protein
VALAHNYLIIRGDSDLIILSLDPSVFLAALGITTLEIVEAAAVALALYGESRKRMAFLYVASGIIVVLVPTLVLGDVISLLPIIIVRLVGAFLLLYFGLRLVRSARRTVLKGRKGDRGGTEDYEKGLFYTGFSVGAIEAFEASIVLVGLLPENYFSTILGLLAGMVIVAISTFILRNQVRKVKQASMKVIVSALLLSFSIRWFIESVYPSLSGFALIPLFAAFVLIIYWVANRPSTKLNSVSSKVGQKL